MLNRRDLVRGALSASILGASMGSFARTLERRLPAVFIVDRDVAGADAIAAAHAGFEAVPMLRFSGDPGLAWVNTIEPALRQRPAAIAGVTSAATLFCLHYLGRDYGLALVGLEAADAAGFLGAEIATATRADDLRELVDLRDRRFRDSNDARAWLLAPTRKGHA